VKHRKKVAATSPFGETPAATSLFAAIPFPVGLSFVAEEETRTLPSFTVREQVIGGWIAEGKTDPEIAHILGLGYETVKTHVKSILQKAGLENRNAFTAWVWRHRFAGFVQQQLTTKRVKYS
jgi:DNA-binding CsgD family transcriptional regulator